MYVDSPCRSGLDCHLIEIDDNKNEENDDLILLPGRKLGMSSDTVDDYIEYLAATASGRVIDKDDEAGFPFDELNEDQAHPFGEEWILKDLVGV